ncbi:uncharacterized protein LOC127792362 [Diospyros lotus]|uniref:uncharacterized protein LOC127792362 n=1 Tax=Diospyros lotus TaxID=55363 RepID=UPI00225B90D4|nr:uncharacterized protein LOC127792362 [Diospyros lotus]
MCTDWLGPLTELAKCAIVPLAKFLAKCCYDLFCYHKVIKELESVASRLKALHVLIQGMVNSEVVNDGGLPVWLVGTKILINELEKIILYSKVESDGKFFLMKCLCTRCCNCGEAQEKMKDAIAKIEKADEFDLRLVGKAQSGGHSKTHKRSRSEVFLGELLHNPPSDDLISDPIPSKKTPKLMAESAASHSLAIIDDQLEMEVQDMIDTRDVRIEEGTRMVSTQFVRRRINITRRSHV